MKDLSFVEKIQAIWAIVGTAIFNWAGIILLVIPSFIFRAVFSFLPEEVKQLLSKLFPDADFDF